MRFRIPAFLRFLTIAGVLTASSLQLFAQVGKIEGRVINQQTREPIPGANVLIEESTMGAGADMDGNYFIINVRPGVYNIRTSAIGYQTVVTQEVRVSIDLTTRIDFELPEAVLKLGEEVVVVAERPIIQRDLTATTAVISGDLIQALPVTEFTQVLNLQAGFVDGHLRGGRSGEIAYWIDGMPVTDVYDGGIVVEVGTNSIQEMQLISGAFSAEYGQAMSGVVNIVTRDGTNQFRANVSTYGGDYVTKNDGIFLGHTDPNPWNIRNLEAGLSGPVINDKLFFDTNLRYIYFNGWLYGRRVFNPANITDNRSTNIAEWIPSMNPEIGRGDSSFVSMNPSEKYYAQGKLTFRASPALRLSYNFIYDDVRYRDFDFAFILNPGGDFQRFRTGYTHIANLNHMLSSRTFYTLGFSYFKKDYRHYVYENPKDSLYVHPRLLGQAPPYSAATGGTKMQWFKRNTESYVAKIDVTSQITRSHQIKTGVEFRYHELFFRDITLIPSVADANREPVIDGNPYITTEIPSQESFSHNEFLRNPVELSWYIQDKMEFDDMVVNLGVRFDYFMPDGHVLADPSDPNIYLPLRPENQDEVVAPGGSREQAIQARRAYWYTKAKNKYQLSPRLGVAFPITDRGKIHFSYGHFFQIPNFDLLYQNPEFKLGTGTGNVGVVGNSDLKAEQTISGEIGLQQQLTHDIGIEITGYFRDIRNLAGTRADEIAMFGGTSSYNKYVNSDFGFVRGIIIRFEKRFSGGFAATVDYTLQTAKGNASDPQATRNFLIGGVEPEEQLIPLNWDQSHTINLTTTYASPSNWGGSMIARYGSGLPYTPRQTANVARLLVNSEKKPQYFNVDLNAYKDFQFNVMRISLWTRIINLLDIRNQINVYTDSGRADYTVDLINARRANPPELINTLEEYYNNPTFYSEPRRIEVGISVFL
jgi:hypothetical protein